MLQYAFLITALITATHANDWSVPCTSGSCGYVWKGDGSKTAPSSMTLAGANQILSDISPAAGWQVMGCNPNWSNGSHSIRMVCAGTPEQTSHCGHLYDNGGPENTVVRLPQNCGTGPFARVQSTFVPTDQSLPSNITAANSTANSTSPNVRGLVLDYNFAAIPPSRGKLSYAAQSSNNPAPPLSRRDLLYLQRRGRSRSLQDRGFGLPGVFNSIAGGVTSAAGAVASVGNEAANAVTSVGGEAASVATSVGSEVTSAVASAATAAATAAADGVNALQDATAVNENQTSGTIPIKFANTFSLIDASVDCGPTSANLKIDVDANVDTNVQFGYTFHGSIVPPLVQDFSMFSNLDGDVAATYNIQAQAQGTIDSGSLALFKLGLPGLEVPGIVSIGPEFVINGQLSMTLDIEASMTVTTDVTFDKLHMAFPQNSGQGVGSATPNNGTNNGLKLSAAPPSVDVTATLTGHVVPKLNFGMSIGGGLAEATVFLSSDLSGVVELTLHAGAAGAAPASATADGSAATDAAAIDPNASAPVDTSTDTATDSASTDSASAASTDSASVAPTDSSTSLSTVPSHRPLPVEFAAARRRSIALANMLRASKRAAVAVNGCVKVTTAIDISAGLDGSLPPVFQASQTFPIFSTSAVLFTKCFGNDASAAPVARSIGGGSPAARAYSLARVERRRAAPRRRDDPAPSSDANEITPEKSSSSTSGLSCGVSNNLTPLSVLQSLV